MTSWERYRLLQTEREGDTLVTAIFLTPTRELHQADLTCRAEVANLTGYLEDSLRLDVKCERNGNFNFPPFLSRDQAVQPQPLSVLVIINFVVFS